jgi:predicted acyl esterase
VASFRPKGLDAITPFHIVGDLYRDVAYPGGVYDATLMNNYSAGLVSADAQAAAPGIKSGDRQCIRDFRAHVKANRQYSIAPNMLANPFDNAYWQTSPASGIRRIDIPVLGCQSWQDGITSSRATELYSDGAFSQKTSWFVGMNGPHGICESDQPLSMMVNFLRHYVAGADDGWQKTPHITILHQVSAATSKPAWTSTYRSWSTVVKPVTLYFHADGSLAAHPATSGGTSSFSGPAPAQSGSWTAAPQPDTSVSYTTAPLAHDADFFGPASVNLWLSAFPGPRAGEPLMPDAPDTDIEVILSEVRPDGKEQYVQAGWLDVAQRSLAPAGNGPQQSSLLRPYQTHTQASYQPLTPDRPVYARVELFPFEHVFRAGSSIRITIDSAMGAVQSTGDWGLTGLPDPIKDTIYASPGQQSQIVLGLIPGTTAKAPLPACNTIAGEPCRPNAVPVPPGRLTIP